MKFSLGFSTCPNDTFMFDAMAHQKIDTEGFDFDVIMADVEVLNRKAFMAETDITKLSYHAFAYVANQYQLLTSGSALGYKNGPLLISKKKIYPDEVAGLKIAIPGKYTTANLLFRNEFPEVKEVKEYVFSEIEEAVLSGEADAGIIIHENRFTYEGKGLQKIIDLGESWEQKTGFAIPLGGIAVNRKIEKSIRLKIGRILKRSVEYALSNPVSSYAFVKDNARELDDEVIRKHISLYVNKFSIEIGEEGKAAVYTLFEKAEEHKLIPRLPGKLFVE